LFYGLLGKRHLTQHTDAETPIISAIVKNEIALYSSFILTVDGLYGSGLALLRSVYEAYYVTNSMIYLLKRYYINEGEFQLRRNAAKTAVQAANIFLSAQGRQVIREYSRVWQLVH
jgi:hypothetical protein